MMSIRKQLFSIFLAIGLIIVIAISLLVNSRFRYNFNVYLNDNISKAEGVVVDILQEAYDEGKFTSDLIKDTTINTAIGNFAIGILNENKKFLYGTTKAEFLQRLKDDEDNKEEIHESYYKEHDREIYDSEGNVVYYARIGYYPTEIHTDLDKKFERNVNTSIIWCASIIFMCFIFAGMYLSRLFTYHIYGISKTSIALADGKLKARYPFKSKIKEIETLRYSMNYLGDKLEKQDALRKQLISDISHEIRTPLQILQSNLEAMIDGIYPIDEEQLNVLYNEVVRFGKLLSNLDLLKNIEDNELRIEKKVVNLNDSINEVFDSFKILAKEKKINYTIKTSETDKLMVFADKDSLKQMWMNLLSNAFKFTEKGEIKLTTAVDHKYCIVTVEDTGIGISENDLPYVFERMYRADKSREKYQGSGIGLTMVKKLVEKHDGKISVESTEGKGTKISIKLPIYTFMLEPNYISSKMKSYINIGNKKPKE